MLTYYDCGWQMAQKCGPMLYHPEKGILEIMLPVPQYPRLYNGHIRIYMHRALL